MPYEGVVEGVYQVGGQGLTGPGDCCVYLIDSGDGGSVLVDAGLGSDPEALARNIGDTGHRLEDVRAVVLTHCHIDHVGGTPSIVEASGCEVVAHEDDLRAIEAGDPVLTAADAYGVTATGVEVTRTMREDGGVLDYGTAHIVVVHTPGHTPGSISLRMELGTAILIFGADIHGPFRSAWGSDLNAWRRSMNRLIAMAPDILLEGHFGVVQPKASAISFIKEMLDQDMRVL